MEELKRRIIPPKIQKELKYRSTYIKQHPYVGEDGIYVPCEEYVPE